MADMQPRHMPWDGSHVPFTIGLKPLDLADWIEVDDRLGQYLDEKARLMRREPDAVFAAEAQTEAAQAEVLSLLVNHLIERFPDIYRRHDTGIEILPLGRTVRLDSPEKPPLAVAASLVQEDLILMRNSPRGWRFVAASLCFPSTWSLSEKFGRPLHEIHDGVPEFGPGSRNAQLINRIFDNLKPEKPVWRANWSLYADDRLHHGESKSARDSGSAKKPGDERFIRVEYQTLRKISDSGDILFTVRIHGDPIDFISRHPDRVELARALRRGIEGLDQSQLAYKGLVASRDILLDRLAAMADTG